MSRIKAAMTLIATLWVPALCAADAGGYTASNSAVYSFVDLTVSGGAASVLANQDDGVALVTLPFTFVFYGKPYTQVCLSSNGIAYFVTAAGACVESGDFQNLDLTSGASTGNLPAVIPYWTDLVFQGGGAVFYGTLGTPGSRRFIVQWNNAYPQATVLSANPVTFELALYETSNQLLFQYNTVNLGSANPASKGAQSTVGIRDASGNTSGRETEWSYDAAVLNDASSLLFAPAYSLVPPAQLSITTSGLAVNRGTQLYTGTMTVKNIGSSTLTGPWQVALTALPTGVALANLSGTFAGIPYISVSSPATLPAGQSLSFTIQFTNPSNVAISSAPYVYTGGLQ